MHVFERPTRITTYGDNVLFEEVNHANGRTPEETAFGKAVAKEKLDRKPTTAGSGVELMLYRSLRSPVMI